MRSHWKCAVVVGVLFTCSVGLAETCICESVVVRSHNLLNSVAVQIWRGPISSHLLVDDDCSAASASKYIWCPRPHRAFRRRWHVAILELLLALRSAVAVCDLHVLMRLHTLHCAPPFRICRSPQEPPCVRTPIHHSRGEAQRLH